MNAYNNKCFLVSVVNINCIYVFFLLPILRAKKKNKVQNKKSNSLKTEHVTYSLTIFKILTLFLNNCVF